VCCQANPTTIVRFLFGIISGLTEHESGNIEHLRE